MKTMNRIAIPAIAVAAVAVLVLVGCGGEPVLPDDADAALERRDEFCRRHAWKVAEDHYDAVTAWSKYAQPVPPAIHASIEYENCRDDMERQRRAAQ